MFKVTLVVLLVVLLASISAFAPRGMRSSQTALGLFGAKKKKEAAPPAKAAPKSNKDKKDMTWGGRPDPTPEAFVDVNAGFLAADWRYNKPKSKK